jgi:hypothetical protein
MRYILAALALLAAPAARADYAPPVTDPLTIKACGECHMVFQPSFLPARSWDKMMGQLNNHFGDNAAMAPDKAAHIRQVLMDGAADRAGGRMGHKALRGLDEGQTPLRITETPNFQRKHRLPDSAWSKPNVMTKSNCQACHLAADKGIYEDD